MAAPAVADKADNAFMMICTALVLFLLPFSLFRSPSLCGLEITVPLRQLRRYGCE
jgi:hypothetical protein